jgi:molybdopterin/thiamine biosynthesis adenylyltransferase
MVLVFLMAGALWGFGAMMKAPVRLRLMMIAGLWAGVVLAHAVLPPGNPVRSATGGDLRVWLSVGMVAVVIGAYRAAVGALRRRAATVPDVPAPKGGFRPAELDRYARHIMLREIGGPGQRALKDARVLVVGAGGLGAPAMLYLAGAGVGLVGVIDDDVVEGSNLQRQIIHTDQRIGMPKVFSAEIAMRALNPFIEVRPYNRRMDEAMAMALIADYDLVLDGTDTSDTREMVNRACVALGKPLISGSITQWEGQLTLFDPAHGAPCRDCIFPNRPAPGLVPSCAEAGVAAPLPGVIGAMMALEAVKEITGAGEGLRGRLMIHDALYAETRMIAIARRAGCAICGDGQGVAQSATPAP